MSEEILNALIQLFAIIAKQDEGVHIKELEYVESFLSQQLSHDAVQDFLRKFKEKAGIAEDGTVIKPRRKLVSVKDSVRILGLCRKINKTLNQQQKVVVLVRLFEMVNTSRQFTDQRMAIIDTVAEVFNISKSEYEAIKNFVIKTKFEELDADNILIVSQNPPKCQYCKTIKVQSLFGSIIILRVSSVELYFLKYTGTEAIQLNGLPIYNNRIYLFARGSTIRFPRSKPVYYSDVVAKFLADKSSIKISFDAIDIHYRFPSGDIGLQRINLSETHGKLVGIMGASGSGKTTLLNVLNGTYTPTSGKVIINGVNLHKEKEKLEGLIGNIPQDDLLIEELTVFENLYYSARLCFRDKSKDEIINLVNQTLQNLGLYEIRNLKVGNIFNKLISGGQRKRLNIALELIREPWILFVDEPTSGLSSRDSENVMDLLRELALKGKLVIVVIHQPSSDIYKMFDSMLILDMGGYQVYYGNPIEAIIYFKTLDKQVNSEVGECPVCGNVKPELIFDILEAKVVDEYGRYKQERKVPPHKWEELFYKNREIKRVEPVKELPPKNLNLPSWFSQFKIFLTRDIKSKISNTQYLILSLTEAPLLGIILSFLIRYIADPMSNIYLLYDNDNIPPYIFMSIVVALFLGLTVSAEEIFRDRKILKREKFLNLSRSAYLMAKISILIIISAIQSYQYIVISNAMLGIYGLNFHYWFALFTVFVFANLLGLNISASFDSAVTIYILIPLLLIPQMALGGAMFSFDKLNRKISRVDKVPLIAEFMTSRWAYEALMVDQFKNNYFEKHFFELDKAISQADFIQTHWEPALEDALNDVLDGLYTLEDEEESKNVNIDSLKKAMKDNLALLRHEISERLRRDKKYKNAPKLDPKIFASLYFDKFNEDVYDAVMEYLTAVKKFYGQIFFQKDSEKEAIKVRWSKQSKYKYIYLRNKYHNEYLEDIVTNTYERYKILRYKDKLVQQIDPIFEDPDDATFIGFRAHFYAPTKYFMGIHNLDTYWFNMAVIWIMTILLYPPLYYEHLRKFLNFFSSLKLKKLLKK